MLEKIEVLPKQKSKISPKALHLPNTGSFFDVIQEDERPESLAFAASFKKTFQ